MKLTKQQFKKFILNEVKKIALVEGWSEDIEKAENATKTENINVALEPTKEEPKVELEEVKKLTEEFKRMKELIDFRSPLLRDIQ
jgi:hypothetical protein